MAKSSYKYSGRKDPKGFTKLPEGPLYAFTSIYMHFHTIYADPSYLNHLKLARVNFFFRKKCKTAIKWSIIALRSGDYVRPYSGAGTGIHSGGYEILKRKIIQKREREKCSISYKIRSDSNVFNWFFLILSWRFSKKGGKLGFFFAQGDASPPPLSEAQRAAAAYPAAPPVSAPGPTVLGLVRSGHYVRTTWPLNSGLKRKWHQTTFIDSRGNISSVLWKRERLDRGRERRRVCHCSSESLVQTLRT